MPVMLQSMGSKRVGHDLATEQQQLFLKQAYSSVNSKGNQPWIFTGRTDAETEAPVLQSSDRMCWLIGIDPDAGKDWRQQEKGVADDEMVSIADSVDINLSKFWEIVKSRKPGMLQSMWSQRVRHNLVTEQQQFFFSWCDHLCAHFKLPEMNWRFNYSQSPRPDLKHFLRTITATGIPQRHYTFSSRSQQ